MLYIMVGFLASTLLFLTGLLEWYGDVLTLMFSMDIGYSIAVGLLWVLRRDVGYPLSKALNH